MPTLLDNASDTGAAVTWSGGAGTFAVAGTFGGSTVTLQYLGPDASTWLAAATGLTSAGLVGFTLPPGRVRAAVSGGSPSGLYASAEQHRS